MCVFLSLNTSVINYHTNDFNVVIDINIVKFIVKYYL